MSNVRFSTVILATFVVAAACDDAPKEKLEPPPAKQPAKVEKLAKLQLETEPKEAADAPAPQKARGEEGKFGKKDKAKAMKKSLNHGVLGQLKGAKGGGAVNDAFSGLQGSSVGTSHGVGGLGTRGTGAGGGGGSIGIGDLGSESGGGLGYGRGASGTRSMGNVSYRRLGRRAPVAANFQGHDATINRVTHTADDRLSTFAIDVDTAAYSIARRQLLASRAPTPSLVRVEEFINYFRYDYDPPKDGKSLFSIQADGARSPVDETKHLLRVGIQAKAVEPTERKPANLVFLVDTSCSMTSPDKLQLAKQSMEVALTQLNENDRVAITTYAGGVRLVLPPTRGHEKSKIRAAIRNLRNGGGTAMASGMTLAYQQAAQMLEKGKITRVIVMSDGDANIGATSHGEMLKRIKKQVKAGVTMSTIGYGQGNYKDATMEQLANDGNGNYFYIDSPRMAERVFGRDFTKMIQDVAQDVKIQVEFDPEIVEHYRLVGYENRDVADKDFRNDKVDAGEIGAGHQVTALYEVKLKDEATSIGTIRVRAKKPGGTKAKEVALRVPMNVVDRAFSSAPDDFRFATAVMGAAEIFRKSPHAEGWTLARVLSIASDTAHSDPDRKEFVRLIEQGQGLFRTPVARR